MSVNVTEKVNSKSEVKTNRIPSKIKGGKLYSFNKIKMSKIVELFNKKLYSQRIITWYSLPSMLI